MTVWYNIFVFCKPLSGINVNFTVNFNVKVKKYKKASRATPALDTSVVLECVLI